MKLSEIHPSAFLLERNEFWFLGENAALHNFAWELRHHLILNP